MTVEHASLAEMTKKVRNQLDANRVMKGTSETIVDKPAITLLDVSDNIFTKNMNNSELCESEKTAFITNQISLLFSDSSKIRSEDIAKFEQILNEFEIYYTHLQDTSIDTDQMAIEEMTQRIKTSDDPELRKMLDFLTSGNSNIKQCIDLFTVMKTARGMGKTIEEVQAALRASDEIQTTLEKNKIDIVAWNNKLSEAKADVIKQKRLAEENKVGGFIGFGKYISDDYKERIRKANAYLSTCEERVKTINAAIADAQLKLNNYDEFVKDERFQILRSFDLVKHGLKEKIENSAKDVVSTINSVRNSVKVLLKTTKGSETGMVQIIDKIDNARIERAIVIAALTETYENNIKQIEMIGQNIQLLQTNFDNAVPESVEAGRIKVDLMRQTTTHRLMLAYNQRIDTMLKIIQLSDAKSVISMNDSERVLQSVKNNRDGLNALHNQTLPSLSEGMRVVLSQFADDQEQEFRMAIAEVTKQLGSTVNDTAQRALQQQTEFHEQKMKSINEILNQLNTASSLMAKSLEDTMKRTADEEQLYQQVTKAANELRNGMTEANEIHAQVKSIVREAGENASDALGFKNTDNTPT